MCSVSHFSFFCLQIVGNYDCTLGGGHNMSSKLARVSIGCVCVWGGGGGGF